MRLPEHLQTGNARAWHRKPTPRQRLVTPFGRHTKTVEMRLKELLQTLDSQNLNPNTLKSLLSEGLNMKPRRSSTKYSLDSFSNRVIGTSSMAIEVDQINENVNLSDEK